jgi:hypothetical protein
MAEFLKFSALSIGSALIVTFVLAGLAKPLTTMIRHLLYASPEHRSANQHD